MNFSAQIKNYLFLFLLACAVFLNPSFSFAELQCTTLFQAVKTNTLEAQNIAKRVVSEGYIFTESEHAALDAYLQNYLKLHWSENIVHMHTSQIFEVMRKNPELVKPHFRHVRVNLNRKVLPMTERLIAYRSLLTEHSYDAYKISMTSKQPGRDIALKEWKELLDIPSNEKYGASLEIVNTIVKQAEEVTGYSGKFWNSQRDLKSVKIRFRIFEAIRDFLIKNGKDTRAIDHMLWQQIISSAYSDVEINTLLNSSNGLDLFEIARRSATLRQRLAENLFPDGIDGLIKKIGKPKSKELNTILKFERDVDLIELKLSADVKDQALHSVVVRPLTLQESPFRGCIGGDCSSKSYFSKAFDPNYIYFTLTKNDFTSQGHVTLVLGQALDRKSKKVIPVAFVDKIQGIPIEFLPAVINAISISVQNSGYILAIADYRADEISMWSSIREFGKTHIIQRATKELTKFTPNSHQYNFPNSRTKYSRADNKLNVFVIEPFDLTDKASIELR